MTTMSNKVGYGKRYLPDPRQSVYEDTLSPPNYEQAVSTSSVTDGDSFHRRSTDTTWPPTSPFAEPSTPSSNADPMRRVNRRPQPQDPQLRPQTTYTPNYERYVYTYRLVAGGTPISFIISVEPQSGRPTTGKYTFRLSFKTNGVERPLCEPVERFLAVGIQNHSDLDPRHLEFIVFVFPGKSSLPASCLWSVRVWLRANGTEHRLFGDDELWVGKDPDFNAIGDASFGRPKMQDSNKQVYHAFVGRTLVTFTFRWERVTGTLYRYSLDYDSGGVGANLFEDFRLKIDGDPRSVNFLVFTVPANSVPAGASHKLRVWLRSPAPLNQDPNASYVLPFNDSYIYQRIWKTDDFKIGAALAFENLGPKMVMGFATGGPETIAIPHPLHHQPRHDSISSIEGLKSKDHGYDF